MRSIAKDKLYATIESKKFIPDQFCAYHSHAVGILVKNVSFSCIEHRMSLKMVTWSLENNIKCQFILIRGKTDINAIANVSFGLKQIRTVQNTILEGLKKDPNLGIK